MISLLISEVCYRGVDKGETGTSPTLSLFFHELINLHVFTWYFVRENGIMRSPYETVSQVAIPSMVNKVERYSKLCRNAARLTMTRLTDGVVFSIYRYLRTEDGNGWLMPYSLTSPRNSTHPEEKTDAIGVSYVGGRYSYLDRERVQDQASGIRHTAVSRRLPSRWTSFWGSRMQPSVAFGADRHGNHGGTGCWFPYLPTLFGNR